MRTRWGILISGNGSTLQSLLNCREACDIAVVISSRAQAYGLLRARRAGVAVEVLPEELKKDKGGAEKWIAEKLKQYNVQKIFLAGFMKIISADFIRRFEGKIFNIHPSLLPKYKGLDSFGAALRAGDQVAGVTVHHVNADVDSGKIIQQRAFEIPLSREEKPCELWLHINEQRLISDTMRKIEWQSRLT